MQYKKPPRALPGVLLGALLLSAAAPAQIVPPPQQATDQQAYSYADLADLAGLAPVAADVQIRESIRLKGADAAGVPPGTARFFLVADVLSLLRGAQGLPGQVRFLADFPLDASNRAPRLKKARFLLLGALVPGKPGGLRLVAPGALMAWTAERDARLRGVLTEMVARDAPPRVTGIGHAFHVPGSLPGESETQIFLTTADNRPVSLSILRRPGEEPRWSVALGEMVDEAAKPPAPDTLLWYRLACFLPATLPDSATDDLSPADAEAARADYALVTAGLGSCVRHFGGAG